MFQYADPFNILVAINQLIPQLNKMVDKANWSSISSQLDVLKNKMLESHDNEQNQQIADDLLKLFEQYPEAIEQILKRCYTNSIVRNQSMDHLEKIFPELIDARAKTIIASMYSASWSVDSSIEFDLIQDSTRKVIVKTRDLDKSKVVKLQNIQVDFGEMTKIAAGAMLVGFEAIDTKHPLVVAAFLLIIIGSMYDSATVSIEKEDAAVFWGLVEAHDPITKSAPFQQIVERTNAVILNSGTGLENLSAENVKRSLQKLAMLGCTLPDKNNSDIWKIIDSYSIK